MVKIRILENKFKFWLPVIIWLFVIFYFSNEPNLTIGSGGASSFVIRKFAHIGEFGFLALLFLLPLMKIYGSKKQLVFFTAFLLTVIVAFTDEFHQTFILGRNGNLKDILVDSLGAFLFLQIVAFMFFAKKRLLLILSICINLLAIFFLLNSMVQSIAQGNQSLLKEDYDIEQGKPIVSKDVGDNLATEIEIAEKDTLIRNAEDKKDSEDSSQNVVIPDEVLLPVPFSSQAPLGIWDEVHEEACEEMSLIMVKYYLDKKELSPQIAEDESQKLKEYQLEKNGHFADSDMKELSEIAVDYFGLVNVNIKQDLTKADILESLAQGSPVIIPTAGRLLGNPNFSGLGPLYHNLVVIGFEGDEFITNDPGTRKGEKYRYKMDILINAIHDYTGDKNKIEKGAKVGLIFVKNI